jgi:hypothetical protein
MPTNPIVVVGNIELRLKFLLVETPFDPLPNFAANPINIPFLTTSMLSTTTVSTPVVVILTSSD